MAGRFIAQLIITGSQVFLRAFVDAYRQAVANGGKAATQTAQKASTQAESTITKRTGMSLEEAVKILNVEKTSPADDIEKKFQYLFKINDKSHGGSFYLQSKVYRAKERIDLEFGRETVVPQEEKVEKEKEKEENQKEDDKKDNSS